MTATRSTIGTSNSPACIAYGRAVRAAWIATDGDTRAVSEDPDVIATGAVWADECREVSAR